MLFGFWGMNAFATTLIAYFRTLIFRTSTDTSTDFFFSVPAVGAVFAVFIFKYLFASAFSTVY
jgi:hypothetical protein